MAILIDPVQAGAAAKLAPFMLFCIGAAALFFVFRRSITRRKQAEQHEAAGLRSRAGAAQHSVEEIAEREWLRKHRRALRLMRDGKPLAASVRQALEQVSVYQRRRVAA
jgi:hypothetical protein